MKTSEERKIYYPKFFVLCNRFWYNVNEKEDYVTQIFSTDDEFVDYINYCTNNLFNQIDFKDSLENPVLTNSPFILHKLEGITLGELIDIVYKTNNLNSELKANYFINSVNSLLSNNTNVYNNRVALIKYVNLWNEIPTEPIRQFVLSNIKNNYFFNLRLEKDVFGGYVVCKN